MKHLHRHQPTRAARTLATSIGCIALGALAAANDARTPRTETHDLTLKPPPQAIEKTAPRVLEDRSNEARAGVVTRASTAKRSASQEPRTPPLALDDVWFDSPGDGSLWALGATYKAQFASERVTYVPFLGSNAPRNFPIALDLASITIGGESIAFDDGVAATRDARSVAYDRGAFVELYELAPDSLEQMFVFHTLPRDGEIVVRIDVTTTLARSERDLGFDFTNEHGRVTYGRASVRDGAGRVTPVTTALEGTEIVIRVPSDVAASAVLPLTIDPVVSTFHVDASAEDDMSPDTAYDATYDRFVVVYERKFSASDYDVVSQLTTSAGAVIPGTTAWIDFTSSAWRSPKVANRNLADQFLTVAEVTDGVSTPAVRGRTRSAGSNVLGAQFTISSGITGAARAPDVGGDPTMTGPTYYCVVWQREFSADDHDIVARLVRSDGTLVGATPIPIDTTATTLDRRPSVSKSNGFLPDAAQRWNIAWERAFSAFDTDIRGAQLAWDGLVVTPSFSIDASDVDDTRPSASSPLETPNGSPPYLVVYEHKGALDDDIWGTVRVGALELARHDLSWLASPSFASEDQHAPSVDSDGRHFAVAWSESYDGSSQDYDVFVSDYYLSNLVLEVREGHVGLGGWNEWEGHAQIASRRSGAGAARRHLVAWTHQSSIGGPSDVEAAIFDGAAGGMVTTVCSGDGTGSACPCNNFGAPNRGCASSASINGARLSTTGDASTIADTFALHGSFMPANGTCLYFQGTAVQNGGNGSAFGDGLRCAAGTIVRLGTKVNSGGASHYPAATDASISVRGAIPSFGATRFYQAWYRNAAAYCTSSTFNLSNGLRVSWSP